MQAFQLETVCISTRDDTEELEVVVHKEQRLQHNFLARENSRKFLFGNFKKKKNALGPS